MSWEYWVPDREPVPDWAEIVAAKDAEIERLRAEVETWVAHAKTAIWSDSEECKMLAADHDRLRAALTEIRDAGPMTVDDQRWRVAKDALEGKHD